MPGEIDFTTAFVDTAGYEELRKHIRESTEFTKELALVLEERAKVEMNYVKLLNNLTVKASKITRTNSGTLSAAWNVICGQFNAEADVHKAVADTILRDVQKPMKKMAEQQAKSYKLFEAPVDKSVKSMTDSRAELMKKKKNAYSKSKESQTLINQVSNPNNPKGKPISDKDMAKLKTKSQKAEEVVAKAEAEYMKQLLMTERSRQQHEVALVGAASTVQKLEIDRINQQKALLAKYSQTIWDQTPKLQTTCDSINRALNTVQADADVTAISKAKGKPPQPTYQLLMDTYEEEQNSAMSTNQRKVYVKRQIKMIDAEITREEKNRDDIARNQRNSSTKSSKDGRVDTRLQLMHSDDTINMLIASKYKMLTNIAEMDSQQKPASGMSQFIRISRDKQGATLSTLHYPRANAPDPRSTRNISAVPSLVLVAAPAPVAASGPRGAVAATAVVAQRAPPPPQQVQSGAAAAPPAAAVGGATAVGATAVAAARPPPPPGAGQDITDSAGGLGMYTVIYDFVATDEEQLNIKAGDVINLLEMDEDGWWRGEINGLEGIFPASYVEKLNERDDDEV